MRPRDRLLWRRVDVVMKLLVDGAMLRLLPMDMTLELAIDEIERQLAIAMAPRGAGERDLRGEVRWS